MGNSTMGAFEWPASIVIAVILLALIVPFALLAVLSFMRASKDPEKGKSFLLTFQIINIVCFVVGMVFIVLISVGDENSLGLIAVYGALLLVSGGANALAGLSMRQ